ncbi:MAG: HmuY family protein [Bacteroidota bacterium]
MRAFPLILALACVASACDSSDEEVVIRSGGDTLTAPASGPVARYAFATEREVPADSAQTVLWDVGVQGTNVILNSGSSGPGAGIGVVVEVPFEDIDNALTLDVAYRRDGESPCDVGFPQAVCSGDLFLGNDPVDGRTLLLRLGDGQGYAKVEVTGYDASAGALSFRYVVNPGGPEFVETD